MHRYATCSRRCSRRRRRPAQAAGWRRPLHASKFTNVDWLKLLPQYVNALLPQLLGNGWGLRGGVEMGTYWSLQYQTHMQAPNYDVQFLRSEALRCSSSSSRTRQIKECYIINCEGCTACLVAGSNWCREQLGCAHHCHSTALGTRCICRRGFRLHPNGKDCIGLHRLIYTVYTQPYNSWR